MAKNRRGRPTKYSDDIPDELPDMFKDGQSVCEVCVGLGISKETFYEWIDRYPAFADSYKKGLMLSQQWWERVGRAGAIGKVQVNPAMWIYNMKNRFRADWKDRSEVEVSGTDGGPVAIRWEKA